METIVVVQGFDEVHLAWRWRVSDVQQQYQMFWASNRECLAWCGVQFQMMNDV